MKAKMIYYTPVLLLLLAASCSKEKTTTPSPAPIVPVPAVKAAFTVEKVTSFAPLRLQLQNGSQHADSFVWTVLETGATSTAASPEFLISRKGVYHIKLVSTKGMAKDSIVHEVMVQNDPSMKGLYRFSNNWSDSSDHENHIGSGHGLLRADPDRRNKPQSCINMGTSGGALFLPEDMLRSTGTATTISIWIKANTLIRNPVLGYWKDNEPTVVNIPSIYFDATGKLRLKFATGAVAPQITVEGLMADTWYHIVLTGEGPVQKAYVNAELVGTINSDPINHGTMNTAALGYMYVPNNSIWGGLTSTTWSSYNFKGFFDDVRIYNRMISDKEVRALYED